MYYVKVQGSQVKKHKNRGVLDVLNKIMFSKIYIDWQNLALIRILCIL